jgi:glycine/D-amino acid oxidase-like deaminating enzyme
VLTLQSNSSLDLILNKGIFLLPVRAGIFKAGSTYDFNEIDDQPTEKGKKQIIEKLRNFFLPKFDVIGHDAGIRPATLDRRPFLGMHVNFKNIVIFNGLGAKGVTLAPYFSEILVNFLENSIELEKEVSIERFSR